jgi:hypothetical protein
MTTCVENSVVDTSNMGSPSISPYDLIGDESARYPESSFVQSALVQPQQQIHQENWYGDLENTLSKIRTLPDGWNGYSAPAPGPDATYWANELLHLILIEDIRPVHMGPSVSGGIGFTFENADVEYVVEFINDGMIVATTIDETANEDDMRVDKILDANPCKYIVNRLRELNFV